MFLHYLGKHEPQKWCLFSYALYHVSKTTLLWLAILVNLEPILIIFCRQQSCIIKYSVQILFLA